MRSFLKLATAIQAALLAVTGALQAAEPPNRQAELEAWNRAVAQGTPEAIQSFIASHPESELVEEAFEMLVMHEVIAIAQTATDPFGTAGELSLDFGEAAAPGEVETSAY